MSKRKREDSNYDSSNLIVFLWQWRKTLIIVGIAAAVISSAVALIIPEKYKSTAVMYPTTTASLGKALIATQNFTKLDNQAIGEEEEAEQMLQILQSNKIRERILQKYDLLKHYGIDEENDDYPYTMFQQEWEDNVTFRRNEYLAVEVHVLDHSPDTAMLICRDIIALYDTVKNRMFRERATESFAIVKHEYNEAMAHVKALEDSLQSLGEMGVFDYKEQSAMYSQEYAKAIAKGDQNAVQKLEEKLAILGKHGPAQMSLAFKLEYETDKLSLLKVKYDEAKVDANNELPHKYIIEEPAKPEKKAYPIRWLIVVVSCIAALLLTIIAIITFENIRRHQLDQLRESERKHKDRFLDTGKPGGSGNRSRGGSSNRSGGRSKPRNQNQTQNRSRGGGSGGGSKKPSPKQDGNKEQPAKPAGPEAQS